MTSAGLSSLITSASVMIGQIIDRQDETKLIEMKKVKLIIEDWRNYKIILLTSLYEEYLRESVKKFGRAFMNKYASEIDTFEKISFAPQFSNIKEFVSRFFNENRS